MVTALWRCDEHALGDLARRTVRCLAASSPLGSERNVSGDVIVQGPSNSDVVTYSFFLPFRHHWGGIGRYIAAEESFGRAATAIYENFEQADRAANSQRIA